MKRRDIFLTAIALFPILIILMGMPSYAEEVRGVSKDNIKLGVCLDLTGPASAIAIPISKAVRNYFRFINEQGGINGRKVSLIIEDDRYSVPVTLSAFKKLVYRDEVLAIVGPSATAGVTALFSQVKKERMPIIPVPLTETFVNPYKRYIFMSTTGYTEQNMSLVDYIVKDLKAGNPKIGVVCPDSEYGLTGYRLISGRAKLHGIQHEVDKEIMAVSAVDASSQILNLRRNKVDHIFVFGGIQSTVTVLRDARKFGMDARFFGDFFSCDEDVVRIAGKAAKDFYGVHSLSSWYDDVPGIARLKKITLRYDPKTKPLNRYYIQGWLMSMIVTEGMVRSGKGLDGESLVNSLEGLREFDTGDISGPITYTSTNHKPSEYSKIYKADLEKELMIPVTKWRRPLTLQ